MTKQHEAETGPWTIDAKDIEVSASVDKFRKSLFQTNSQIENFLRDKSRNEVLVVGPKGFGKTLLLKIKRKILENSGYSLLPVNSLLDKPIGTPSTSFLRDGDSLLSDPQYWRSVWLISITALLAKIHKQGISRFHSDSLRMVLADPKLISVCDIFDRIISFPRKEYLNAYEDLRASLIPEFRSIHSPIAMFIDNVDEYFETAIANRDTSTTSKTVKREFWYLAQHGLANAARELNSINNHVKICASIRQEIFQTTSRDDPLALQLRGSAIELKYDRDDLFEIMKKNIAAEIRENLAESKNVNPYERFFGKDNIIIEHHHTSEEERVEEFILRHTLWRPRDIALIGKKLSDVNPQRRTRSKIREIVNAQATLIAETYLGECRPHISNLVEEILFPMISGNVIYREDLVNISKIYDDKLNAANNTPGHENHVFYDLYCLGLLGHVKDDKRGGPPIQHFQPIGETKLTSSGLVPNAKIYLIHPVLYDLIAKYNSDFYSKLDSLNIIGRDRPWRAASEILFVLKGDVVAYSEVMANPDLADTFPAFFNQQIKDLCSNLYYSEIVGGDGILLIDRNWKNLASCARALMTSMLSSIYQRQIRFGGDAGILRFEVIDKETWKNLRGGALRTAARLEVLGINGHIIVTDRFKKYAVEEHKLFSFVELLASDLPRANISGDKFNLAKNESEEGIFHKIYRIDNVSHDT